MTVLTVAVLGLGEAGSRFATGLAKAGAVVRGYDPRVSAMDGVIDNPDAATACHGADVVLSVNSAADALDALAQGRPGCAPGTIWADLNTAAPSVKLAVRDAAGDRLHVVDVAIMAPVPARGLATPMTVSGPAAPEYASVMRRHGATVDVIAGPSAPPPPESCCAVCSTKDSPRPSSRRWRRPRRPGWTSGCAATSATS